MPALCYNSPHTICYEVKKEGRVFCQVQRNCSYLTQPVASAQWTYPGASPASAKVGRARQNSSVRAELGLCRAGAAVMVEGESTSANPRGQWALLKYPRGPKHWAVMEVAFGSMESDSWNKVMAMWLGQSTTGKHHQRFLLSLYSSPVTHYPSLLQDHKLELLTKSKCPPLAFLKRTQSKTTKWTRPFWCLPPVSSLNLLHPFHSHRRPKYSLQGMKKTKSTTWQMLREKSLLKPGFFVWQIMLIRKSKCRS